MWCSHGDIILAILFANVFVSNHIQPCPYGAYHLHIPKTNTIFFKSNINSRCHGSMNCEKISSSSLLVSSECSTKQYSEHGCFSDGANSCHQPENEGLIYIVNLIVNTYVSVANVSTIEIMYFCVHEFTTEITY